MIEREELVKRLPCCGYEDTSAVMWNEFNGVVQCHNCGQQYAALSAQSQQEPAAEAIAEKDEAYRQRNYLVAALARLYPSGVRNTDIPGWSDDWHGCCFIDLPSGQISYHFHDSHRYLFDGLPAYETPWDGHDKDAVHARLLAITAPPSGVREGMLRAAEIVMAKHAELAARSYPPPKILRELCGAITRAAEQVNAEQMPATTTLVTNTYPVTTKDLMQHSAPQSEQTHVRVPMEQVSCPKCGRSWTPPCEQTSCLELFGECIPCRFTNGGIGTESDFNSVVEHARAATGKESEHDNRS